MNTNKKKRALSAVVSAVVCASAAFADIVRFDVNDRGSGSPTLAGWSGVVGAADNADTVTGGDGIHTLTLSSSGDGQDRDRGASGFGADADMWRDFWFAAGSRVGGDTATATVSGLDANTFYSVRIWGFDTASTGSRAALWTDTVSGNTGTSSFNGGTTPRPASLDEYVAVILAKTNASGALILTGSGGSGGSGANPNIFVNGLSVSVADTTSQSLLPTLEAESGTLGSGFGVNALNGATYITISPSAGGTSPGGAARVATYSVQFPKADTYQLFARIYVGPDTYADDSFFYANGFGVKSLTNSADWVTLNGLVDGGFTSATDVVTVGGGAAGGVQVWKWIRLGTYFMVGAGELTKTFQIGGREDGCHLDKFVFGPADLALTVADLDDGIIPEPDLSPNMFEGPDGIAISRFDERLRGINLDGANPSGGLVMLGDDLYGSTLNGGLQGDGTIYRISLDGADFEVVRTLSGGANAANLQGGFVGSGGVFFGVSQTGGGGTGTVFAAQPDGSVSIIHGFSVLSAHDATNYGGACPGSPLALSLNKIYGVASAGGASANGTVYAVSTDGSGFTVLHDFGPCDAHTGANSDGALPYGGVIISGTKLYGTASGGGAGGAGVVFSMDTTGANYTVLHSFEPLDPLTSANTDGASPLGGLVLAGNVLYGATIAGGAGGKGTLFSIRTDGSGFAVLHDFPVTDGLTGTNEHGASPGAGLSLSGDILYGTTSAGGAGAAGTVFSLDIGGSTFSTIHSFEALANDGTNTYGAFPVAPVLRVGNSLYGTAFGGGPGGSGTVFGIVIPVAMRISAGSNPSGGVDITVAGSGAPNTNYTIQAADELGDTPIAWQNLATVASDAGGAWQFVEEHQAPPPRRFYRVLFDR